MYVTKELIMLKNKLKQLRLEHGITQAQLAEKIGASTSAVGMYEQGRRQPDGRTIAKIAAVLGCSTDELLEVEHPSDVNDAIDGFARTLERQPSLMFNGAPLSASDREKLINAIRVAAAITSGKQ
jgi:transcriptional regulator with XRE-family HTH domain